MIGQTINNRYEITARLGKGAMGTVYRATDTQSGQEVALKVISSELILEPEMLERFQREGEALSKLKHPNIVEFLDAFQHEDHYVIVMEYISGGSLHELIKAGPLSIERARRIALELCDALIRSHHLNVIHRDLKPENVLLAEDGTPKLADFGVARLSEGTRMTRSGTQVGTPYYMSPEAWEGKTLDAQADIWSLGVILFEMLTGQVPFGGDTGAAVMNKVLTTQPPDLKKLRAEVPPNLAKIMRQMLTRDKKRRYPTMRQLAADLERGQLTESRSRPITGVSDKRASLVRWAPVLIGLGIILTLTILWQISQFQASQATDINVTAVAPNGTISPSNTEVEILTPVVASIAEGTVLFEENFEDDRVQGIGFSAETGWQFVTDETGNKVYELDNRNGSAYRGFSFGMDEWTDYSVEYRTRFLNSSESQPELGLQVRSNGNTYYALVLGEEASYLAYSINGSEWTRLNTQLIHVERDAWQNVRVVVQGERISVYLNGTLLINAISSQIRQGWVMIFVGTNTYAQVDDIRVVAVGDQQSTSSVVQPTPTPVCVSGSSIFSETLPKADAFSNQILSSLTNVEPTFQDDFSTTDKGWLENQVPGAWKSGTMEIVDGVLRFTNVTGQNLADTGIWSNAQDFVFETDQRLTEGFQTTEQRITFHLYPINSNNYHHFSLQIYQKAGYWTFRKSIDPSAEDIAEGRCTLNSMGEWNRIMLVVKDEELAILINGHPAYYLQDPELVEPGLMHLSCHSSAPAICEWDNVKFWNLN